MVQIHKSQESGNTLDIKVKWELGSNVLIKDESWEEVSEGGQEVTNSPRWKEFNWRLKIRNFRTPLVKTNLCWRDCQQVGDHAQIFWGLSKTEVILGSD